MKFDMQLIGPAALALLTALVVSFLMTPVVKSFAYKVGAIDVPKDERRMHHKPIPRLGGLAIFAGFMASILLFVDIRLNPQMQSILLGAVIIVVLGVVDDIMALPAKLKFVVQIVAALIPALNGVSIQALSNPNLFSANAYWVLNWLSVPITVLWIVGITNAVNLIDGLDGLANGVSAISAATVLVIALICSEAQVAIVMAALVGACVGFLPYNLNPAKMFMGDTGATFLGFILATMSIQGLFKFYAVISFAVPFLILGLPIFDTAFAMIRRMAHGMKDVPVAIVLEERTPVAQRIAVDFTANPYFDAKVFYAKAPAEKALEAREVECILTIPAGFAANAQQGEAAELGLTVYGVDSNSATLFKSYVLGQLNSSVTKMVSNGMIEPAVASRVSAGPVKSLASRSWFNEASISTWYLVPGILVIVVGAASTMMSAIVIAREWERGTMAAIFATPASPLEIFLAKWLSYWTIAFGGSLLSLCTSFLVFGQPLRGSIAGVLAILLTLTAMGTALGLFISAKVKNQFLAIELAVVLAYMPSLMLSGFLFDLRSVPVWIEFVGRLLPPTYAVEAFKQCFLAGDGPILWRNVGILCCWAALFFCMAVRVLRKRPPVTVPDKSEPKGGASC